MEVMNLSGILEDFPSFDAPLDVEVFYRLDKVDTIFFLQSPSI